MKPIWKDGKLTVELHKPDEAILAKARNIGEALTAMNQPNGQTLVDAIDAIVPGEESRDLGGDNRR
jgi:hypothetical protein